MLVNLTPNETEVQRKAQVLIDHKDDFDPEFIANYVHQSDPQWIVEPGIYQCSMAFNFDLDDFIEYANVGYRYDYEFNPFSMPTSPDDIREYDWSNFKNAYGVADNIEQVKEYFKEAIADPINKYFIHVTPVWQDKENKGNGDGWRWHKWGPYIGTLDPKCEYLDDEDFGDDFEYVICFHIVKVPDPVTQSTPTT